ncbi:MAG: zinc ribbon domain-containing protein [Candidatus Heimdallarchaeaceae archaeon]
MSVTIQVYDKSATDMMKYSALIILISQAVSFGLSFITSDYIGLVGNAIYAVGLFLLGTSAYNIGVSFPMARNDAESARKWLFLYGGSLLFMYIPIVGIAGSLIALVTGIGCFLKLNGLFKRITQSAPQQGRLDSWVFPMYALYGLIAGVVIVIAAIITVFTLGLLIGFLFIFGIIVMGGAILVSLGVAYVLYQNSVKLEKMLSLDFSQLTPAPGVYVPASAPAVYAPVQPVQPGPEVQTAKYCENCGEKLVASDKFCPSCGASLS